MSGINYTNPLDSDITYDSTGVLTFSSQNFTRSTDRSFLSTFIDSDTFTDSFNDADLSDSEHGLFTRLDSANGGDLIFFSNNHDKWYKASVANTNLSSIDTIASLSGSRNIFRKMEYKTWRWALPFQESDGAPLEYRTSGHDEHVRQSLFIEKEDNRFFTQSWPMQFDSSHPYGPDSGFVLEISRSNPVTVGADSTSYNEIVFTYRAFIPKVSGDSHGRVANSLLQASQDYVLDSYTVDISTMDLDTTLPAESRIGGSSFLRFLKGVFPTALSPTAGDIKFALGLDVDSDRDSLGRLNMTAEDSDRFYTILDKNLGDLSLQCWIPNDSQAESLGLFDSGYYRSLTHRAPPYIVLSDS